jgi:hypothetical protein
MSVVRKPAGMELIDLLDRVLDKGIVIDASSRLHLLGVNLARHRKHVVIAAIETHLKHSEARAVAKFAARRAVAAEEHRPPPLQMQPRRGRTRPSLSINSQGKISPAM